jgi:hypothetical protein
MSAVTVAPARAITVVRVELKDDLTGWWADCRSPKDLPARVFGQFAEIGQADAAALVKLAEALETIVVSHNFPDATTGKLAASFLDVAPDALAALAAGWSEKAFSPDPS